MKTKTIIPIVALLVIVFLCTGCPPADGSGSLFGEAASKEDHSAWIQSRTSKDPSLCSGIESNNYRNDCFENVAINLEDVSICERAGSSEKYCISEYAEKTGDMGACELHSNKVDEGNCLRRIAEDTEVIELCYEISERSIKENCLSDIGSKGSDPTVCEDIEKDSAGRDDCFYGVAAKTQDAAQCGKIEEDSDRGYCYQYVAKLNKDISLCSKALKQEDYCIKDVAIETYDLDTCQELSGDLKDQCVDGVFSACRGLRYRQKDNLPKYCQDGVMTPEGYPTSYT